MECAGCIIFEVEVRPQATRAEWLERIEVLDVADLLLNRSRRQLLQGVSVHAKRDGHLPLQPQSIIQYSEWR
jgi:hypothetical protein